MIRFHLGELAKKLAPAKTVKRLVTTNLTLNRAVIKTLSKSDVVSAEAFTDTALEVIANYKNRYGEEKASGATRAEAFDAATNDKVQMVQRVQNTVVHTIAKKVKSQYRGEFYTWLPSDAVTPDPIHQLNYGKTFQVGVGEMPGDRYGCKCGMEIQTDDKELEL